MQVTIKKGRPAPDFELPDQQKSPWKLSDHKGAKIALVFFPFAFSPNCENEFCTLRDEGQQFKNEGAITIGISCDSTHSNRVWSEQNGFEFAILADRWPLGEVARLYGCFNEDVGAANRLTVIIDENGIVVDSFATDSLGVIRDSADYHKALAGS